MVEAFGRMIVKPSDCIALLPSVELLLPKLSWVCITIWGGAYHKTTLKRRSGTERQPNREKQKPNTFSVSLTTMLTACRKITAKQPDGIAGLLTKGKADHKER